MHLPGTPSLVFLAYLFAVLPWMALRSARRFRQVREGSAAQPLPPRETIWTTTLVLSGSLLVLAWLTGRGFGYPFFAVPALGLREIAAAAVALGASFALRALLRATRTEDERRQMAVYRIAPRTPRDWTLWTCAVLVASVAEETAYRGVGMSILWFALGNPWLAALLCATAFALAHWVQGWKSAAMIFAMALVMHGLVEYTETLVLAIVVHAVYDFVAGYQIARDARRFWSGSL